MPGFIRLPGLGYKSYFAIVGAGGVSVGGYQEPDPAPLPAYTCRGSWVSMLVGFSLYFVLKQRCLPGWVFHSLCMYAGTIQKQYCGAVIAGLDKAKREHENSVRHKS